ncbi:MAG: T9SS type A sorting domain-containing protein [Bacteroidales bacterium]|jgi:hypothetical protein|nr:T9SS type A sorting domain-containing protein [Bacteroidales bacterium]
MKKYLFGILISVNCIFLQGQAPVTLGLDHNPILQNRSSKGTLLKNDIQVDTISLPFIDDFSYYATSNYPDPSLWMDRKVFINNNYPVLPRSNGVATFDALDENGQLYNNKGTSFRADTLTSGPIDLGGSDMLNVYLSFFYQPQGIGDAPEEGDSLILQFKSSSERWENVWRIPGTKNHPFKQVLIPVIGTDYLYKGFQFRFVNIVSLNQDKFNEGKKGNADLWHIDYVRLDKNRNINDTTMLDVAMVAPMKSLIKGYQAIPWTHYPVAFSYLLESQIDITYRNNHHLGYLVTRVFESTDLYTSQVTPIGNAGAENIREGQVITYTEEVLDPFITPFTDSALFEIKGYLRTDEYDRKENDTVRFLQVFKNYFARDDGIPESGYGYEGINAQGAAIACRYEMFMPDTLQAVAMYFNPVQDSITRKYRFRIAVWRDDKGRPGEQVYLSSEEYSPEETGKYVLYTLEKPVYIDRYYWIGWQQVTTGFLNVGFDLNYNDKGNLWYNSPGVWQQDSNDGTLMIRPYAGKRSDFSTSSPPVIEKRPESSRLIVYPNPASYYVRIEFESDQPISISEYNVEIFGATGQLRYRSALTQNQVDISQLEQGMYVLRLIHRKTGYVRKQSFLIVR